MNEKEHNEQLVNPWIAPRRGGEGVHLFCDEEWHWNMIWEGGTNTFYRAQRFRRTSFFGGQNFLAGRFFRRSNFFRGQKSSAEKFFSAVSSAENNLMVSFWHFGGQNFRLTNFLTASQIFGTLVRWGISEQHDFTEAIPPEGNSGLNSQAKFSKFEI